MSQTEIRKQAAMSWFRSLRDDICASFETLENALTGTPHISLPPGRFENKTWSRAEGGGGEMALMRGRVFEKVGVNISTVFGVFPEDYRKQIPGASNTGEFWAAGISVVAHMRSPLVPAVHMNTRHIVTENAWFGGGADLTPMLLEKSETQQDAASFHAAFKFACDLHDESYYEKYSKWCDEYFHLKHRDEKRGVGGIFFDYLETDWDKDFAFTQDVGRTFLEVYPKIVAHRMEDDWTQEERARQLERRGRYVEFNLLYDRGTTFGLKTGGNVEAILMSLPPEVTWR